MVSNVFSIEKRQSVSDREVHVAEFWKANEIFKKSVESRDNNKAKRFYDGPPYATGLPHYGHILQSIIKDIVPRYWTMQGYRVERVWGWDTHGLPIEHIMERELGISGKKEIEKIGIEEFNNKCKKRVLQYADDWKPYIEAIGRWVDMDNAYFTLMPDYMEIEWWVVKTLYEKGLLYEGYKPMHVCPRCETPLSNLEVSLGGYTDITENSVYVKFRLRERFNGYDSVSILAWTTTPWTLPANVLLAVSPKLKYVLIQAAGEYYIVAEKLKEKVFPSEEIKATYTAKELVGLKYEPLYKTQKIKEGKSYEVVEADFVSDEEGTGVVHVAPAFGEDDYYLGQDMGSAMIQHVDINGRINNSFPEREGDWVFDFSDWVISDLERRRLLYKREEITHSYPICWRCDTKLMNYATKSWYVAVTKIKKKMLEENEKVLWVPDKIKHGRFGKWLENARDWAISRKRYWSTPIPIWKSNDGDIIVVGSRKELEELSGVHLDNLHRPYIDKVIIKKDGKEYKRVEDVLDVWFDSGSMPYASIGYPFKHKNDFWKGWYPADFIGEAIDQTRGWFYTLLVLGVALMDKAPYKGVVCTGMVLAEDGQKMSKRKKNYPDPMKVVKTYGADAIRLYMVGSPVVEGGELRFSQKDVRGTLQNTIMVYYNLVKYFDIYATMHKWQPRKNEVKPSHVMNKWTVERTNLLVEELRKYTDKFKLMKAARLIEPYLLDISRWYVRRMRQKFVDGDVETLDTMFYVLKTFTKAAAPYIPFSTEYVYQSLKAKYGDSFTKESVHLEDYPSTAVKNKKLLEEMQIVRELASAGQMIRSQNKIKLRQPLQEAKVFLGDLKLSDDMLDILKEELNVKFVTTISTLDGSTNTNVTQVSIKGHKLSISLNLEISQALQEEGLINEVVRYIQVARKEAGLKPDKEAQIAIGSTNAQLRDIIKKHQDMIQRRTKVSSIKITEQEGKYKVGNGNISIKIAGN